MKIAIVTGASSGMGREFVRQIDRKFHLDEIWAVARREDRLRQLQSVCETPVRAFPLDLTRQESIEALREFLDRVRPDVRVLVNAAGFGKIGTYRDVSLLDINDMIDLNCKAAVDVTVVSLPYMGRNGRILEMCSASAFWPLPGLNVYAATKSFLHHFTRALRWELLPRGIRVTAVCPGWVGTEFIGVAKKTQNPQAVKSFPFAARPERVVARALHDSDLGLPVSAYGVAGIYRVMAKLLPVEAAIAAWEVSRRT